MSTKNTSGRAKIANILVHLINQFENNKSTFQCYHVIDLYWKEFIYIRVWSIFLVKSKFGTYNFLKIKLINNNSNTGMIKMKNIN